MSIPSKMDAPGPGFAGHGRGWPALLRLARIALLHGGLLLSSTGLPALAAELTPTHRIVLSDGQSLVGAPVDLAADPTVVHLTDGRPISVPRDSIRKIDPMASGGGSSAACRPSCPYSFQPQLHSVPSTRTPTANSSPASTSAHSPTGPGMGTGPSEPAFVPSPSCPERPSPQPHSSPSAVSARLKEQGLR